MGNKKLLEDQRRGENDQKPRCKALTWEMNKISPHLKWREFFYLKHEK